MRTLSFMYFDLTPARSRSSPALQRAPDHYSYVFVMYDSLKGTVRAPARRASKILGASTR